MSTTIETETTDNKGEDKEALLTSQDSDKDVTESQNQNGLDTADGHPSNGDVVMTIDDTMETKNTMTMENTMATDNAMTMEDTMTMEDRQHDRIEDLTKSLLALDALGEVNPDTAYRKLGFSRYREALKGAQPIRFTKPAETEMPVTKAGLISLMTFSWMTSIMWGIHRHGIESIKDMKIGKTESAKQNADRLLTFWDDEIKRKGLKKAGLIKPVLRFMRTRMIMSALSIFVTAFCMFATPAFILKRLLTYLKAGDVQMGYGIALVLGISCTELIRSLFFGIVWYLNYTTGVRLRAAVQTLLFRKILKLRSLQDKTVGELVNLLSNDGQRIFQAVSIGPLMLPGPIMLLFGLIYTLHLIGPWAMVAMGLFIIFYPFMYLISMATNYFRRKCIVITDKRVRMMNELLTCIKLIKMYAWEKSFSKAIAVIRADERNVLEKGAYVQSISSSTAPMVPVMATILTFLGYVLTGNDLTPVVAFTIVAVLNSLRFTLGVLPFAVKALADSYVSFKRIKDILLMDEMEPNNWEIFNEKYAVVLNKATFRWDAAPKDKKKKTGSKAIQKAAVNGKGDPTELEVLKDSEQTFIDTPALQDLTFMLEKGKHVGICGSVGSGKSSLLSALLGRIYQQVRYPVEANILSGDFFYCLSPDLCEKAFSGFERMLCKYWCGKARKTWMIIKSGKVATKGSMAYASQQAWILNMTVRENILFGQEYDKERYDTVVTACALIQDFQDLVEGDLTEIGERGINLSGGQKQRISLARAVYSDSDIYLLDDPLSAVDIHVGQHIFNECIMKQLKGKTVLFVTHQLQYLDRCDSVMFIKDGKITDVGTHKDLMSGDTEYANLIKMFYTTDEASSVDEADSNDPSSALIRQFSLDSPSLLRKRTISLGSNSSQGSQKRGKRDPLRQMSMMSNRTMSVEEDQNAHPAAGKLVVAEEKKEGAVGWPVYSAYMKAAGGYLVSIFVIFTFFIAIAAQSFSTWWLSYWLDQGSGNTNVTIGNITMISRRINDNPDLHFYTTVYAASLGVMIVTSIFRAFLFMKVTLKASSNMHNKIFTKMLTSPMKFFDTTPVGRIINRFSADLDEIDIRLPSTSEMFIQNSFLILFALGMIAYVSPWFLFALIPMVICFVILNKIFSSGVRELMRMNAMTNSPLISHVTASVQGISTIHAYGRTAQFEKKFESLMDKNSNYFYLFFCSNRWLSFRLDLMSSAVIGLTGLCILLTYDQLTPSMAGLALSFSIQITGLFQFTIRQAIEAESKFVAVQRLTHYSDDVEQEAPAIIKDNRPAANWPSSGEIKFEKYKMRYRDNLPLALKGLGFTVKAQEKIGIVGRSGSGKSSLGVALFRLVEPDNGTIYIDGVDITKIGLQDLRSRLSIIPQDPVLFVGTVRYNLDPFNDSNDDALWDALEKCHVKDTILSLELKLDHMVVENGENFSVGERQLICMARALLRNSKILMLDEATAAIDTETDSLVQETMKEAFSHCTMLIIAHRLNTVLSCDRILVMEGGRVVEYGKPSDLLASPTTKFKAMFDAVEKQQETL